MASAFFDPDDFDATPAARPIAAPVTVEPVTVAPADYSPEKPKFFELKPVVGAQPIAAAQPIVMAEPIKLPPPLELPTEFPGFEAPEGYHVDISDLPIGSDAPLTRKQLREMEKLTGSDMFAEAQPEIEIETELPYAEDLVEQLPALEDEPDLVAPREYGNESLFDLSPNLIIEPTTNSIVIDQVQDLTNYTATVSGTGEILTTGAIQLPILLPDNETGEIAVVKEAEALDAAIEQDNATGFINTVAPMRVTGVINAAKKFRVIPTNLKRGKNHPYLVLTAAVIMVAIGGLTVAAFMLKII